MTGLLNRCSGEKILFDAHAHAREVERTSVLKVTVSVGVASWTEGATDGLCVVKMADLGLYEAKLGGRNRVVAERCQ